MEILSTSYIEQLVYNYKSAEVEKRLSSMNTKKDKFSSISSTLGNISSKVTSLISSLTTLKSTSSTSIFNSKAAVSSNQDLITATADKTANVGAFSLFVNQLAKSDMLLSKDIGISTVVGTSGTHTFSIRTGDGSDGDFTSNVSVTLDGTETNESLLEKIADAVNTDYAEVSSTEKVAANSYSGGASSLTFDVGGTEYTVDVTGGGTYEDLIDELVQEINSNVNGVVAEKVLDDPAAGDVKLKITTEDSDDYVSISHSSGFDLATDLGITATKEIGASGVITASSFTPSSDKAQLSFTSKSTGLDYRIKEISDDSGSSILSQLGLNLGTSRPTFDQSSDPDTAGFVYADITSDGNELNSKFLFNNISVQNNSNEVENLVSGVTFNLKSVMTAGTDAEVNVTVENDKDTVKSEIQEFIDKYNEIYTLVKQKTKSVDGSRGELRGEATTNSLMNALRSVIYTAYGDSGNEFSYLSQIGISFNTNTGLQISDSELFEEKVKNNSEDLQNLFNGDNGLATVLHEKLSSYTGADGYISLAKDNYDGSVQYLNNRIDSVSTSIDKSAELLRKRYQALQSQLAMLMSSQSFFSSGGSSY